MIGAKGLSENEDFMTQFGEIQTSLIETADVVENGTEIVTLTDGSEAEWKVYSGTLTCQDIETFLNEELELFMNLDFVKNYFEVIAEQSGSSIDEMFEEAKIALREDTTTTVDIDFLVDDTYFRGMKIGINDAEERIGDIKILYTGAEYIVDDFLIGISAVDEELSMASLDFVFEQNLGEKTNTYNQMFSISLSEDGKELGSINYTYAYDTTALEVALNLVVEDKEDIVSLDYTATGTKVVNNKEIKTDLSNISLEMNSGEENIGIQFGLEYGIKAIKNVDIAIDQVNVKYLFEMTKEELMDAMENIQANIQAFSYGLI